MMAAGNPRRNLGRLTAVVHATAAAGESTGINPLQRVAGVWPDPRPDEGRGSLAHYPRYARSSSAMSSFFIPSIACIARAEASEPELANILSIPLAPPATTGRSGP